MNNNSKTQAIINPINRRGFTLIELLLVIAIIAVLSSMALGVMRKAQDDAKESATLARIAQIEAILAVELEDYEVRRLPISNFELAEYARLNPNRTGGAGLLTQVRQLRRQILMDIINAEMPRPIVDNTLPSGFRANDDLGNFPTNVPGVGTGSLGFRDWLNESSPENYPNGSPLLSDRLSQLVPARVQSYRRMKSDVFTTNPDFNLPGEYLYALLERIDVDGTPAIELLGNAAVGNSDDDGFKEVVDSWGDPMQLRIWQIDGLEVADKDGNAPPGTDVWTDLDPDFDFDVRDATTGIPKGYRVLDPTQSRDMSKIRTEVVSTRLIY